MQGIFEISFKQIESLDPSQLTQLLGLLLHLEATTFNIPISGISISQKIEVKDGGEDARIEWKDGLEKTNQLPTRLCMFQSKGGKDMTALEFANANVVKPLRSAEFDSGTPAQQPMLKPRISQVLDASGAYIFFYSGALNANQITARVDAIRKMLTLCGRSDAQSAIIQIYDGNAITSWTNEHLPAVVQVCKWLNQEIPFGFQNYDLWSYYTTKTFEYVEDEQTSKHLAPLREHLSNTRTVARIVGLPGLGKSRLAFESLGHELTRKNVVYVDCTLKRPELPDVLRRYAIQGSRAIIVADNCDLELCKLLIDEIKRPESKLSLLTIDINPEENPQGADPFIVLHPTSEGTIRKLIQQIFGSVLPSADIDKVVALAHGFPQIAWLIAEAHKEGVVDSSSLRDDHLFERLVWGRSNKDKDALEAITACSLFTRLGYSGRFEDEFSLVAKKFTSLNAKHFYALTQDFIQRGIIQQRGDFIRVVPRPLALRLAADWWRKCLPKQANDLIKDDELTDNLISALCHQIKMLHHLHKVQELTKDLCGATGPFGQAEVLNTERGSLLFRSFVEVSPDETVQAINQAFRNWSREQLLEVGPGRRNLVWAIEKLCFWQSSFLSAANLLVRLAAAENETWGNNATGQFLQLFQLYLPGTQSTLIERVSLLEDVRHTNCVQTALIIVSAVGSAFRTNHFSRTGGVEQQGARPAQSDYQPKTSLEIAQYWERCLSILTEFATQHSEPEVREKAQEQVAGIIYTCVQRRFLKPLLGAVTSICEARKDIFWSEALRKLDAAKRDEQMTFTGEDESLMRELYALLSPKSIDDRLKQWISDADWDYLDRDDEGNVIDLSEYKAVELGIECAKTWPAWRSALPSLLQGSQKNAFLFGKTLASNGAPLVDIVHQIAVHLSEYPDGSANPVLLGGILAQEQETNATYVSRILDQFAESKNLHPYLVVLTSQLRPSLLDLQRALIPLKSGTAQVQAYHLFSYGKVLDHLPSTEVCDFAEQITAAEEAFAPPVALSIVHMFCYQSEERWSECKFTTRKILMSIELVKVHAQLGHAQYIWGEDATKLLESYDEDMMSYVVAQILAVCESDEDRLFYKFDNLFQPIVKIILGDQYRDKAWARLAPALLSQNWKLRKNMEWLIGHFVRDDEDGPNLFSELPEDFLFDWSLSDPAAAALLGRQIPPFTEKPDTGEVVISDLMYRLLDTHGTNTDFLSSVSRNLWSHSGWGSFAPYYRKLIVFFRQLLPHSTTEVRDWAMNQLKLAESQLEEALKRDEEHASGII
ncbi:MAG: hypothetical protein IPM93_13575 [Candidatus Obscuribacter sp.]|nr:hypothetical protein [Candidatus Obscuribacter sp.]